MDNLQKLQQLRDAWSKTKNPSDRKLIETRAKLLRMSMHPSEVYQDKKDGELEKNVHEILIGNKKAVTPVRETALE